MKPDKLPVCPTCGEECRLPRSYAVKPGTNTRVFICSKRDCGQSIFVLTDLEYDEEIEPMIERINQRNAGEEKKPNTVTEESIRGCTFRASDLEWKVPGGKK